MATGQHHSSTCHKRDYREEDCGKNLRRQRERETEKREVNHKRDVKALPLLYLVILNANTALYSPTGFLPAFFFNFGRKGGYLSTSAAKREIEYSARREFLLRSSRDGAAARLKTER